MMMSDKGIVEQEVISTGSIGLDMALGIGGLPKGRVVEIYGPESSGKTTLALHAISEIQKAGGAVGESCVTGPGVGCAGRGALPFIVPKRGGATGSWAGLS